VTGSPSHNLDQNDQDHFRNLSPKSLSYKDSQKEVRLVTLLKKTVPVFTGLVLAALVLWPLLSQKEGSFTLAVDRLEKRDETAKLIKPQYVGIDRYGNPVRIAAESAYRESHDQMDYHLKNLLAELKLKGGENMQVKASSGIFQADAQKMILDGDVKITTDTGYKLTATESAFLINEKLATGDRGVSGTAPFGKFSATRFEVDVDEEIVRLSGNVKMHINPRSPLDLAQPTKEERE
tara:strand:- start:4895 stop:5602 length:708 start_codon:yes stop_codon:yes gene_type:complete